MVILTTTVEYLDCIHEFVM